jgi:hypothetical protein
LSKLHLSDVETLGVIAVSGLALYVTWNIYQDIKTGANSLGQGFDAALAPIENWLAGIENTIFGSADGS